MLLEYSTIYIQEGTLAKRFSRVQIIYKNDIHVKKNYKKNNSMKKSRLMELAGLSHLVKEALNKDLKDFGRDVKAFLESKNLRVELGEGDARPFYKPIGDNPEYAGLVLGNQGRDLFIIVNDTKAKILEDVIKKYNLEPLKDQKSSGSWASADTAGTKKTLNKGDLYNHTGDGSGGKGYYRKGDTFELIVRRFKMDRG